MAVASQGGDLQEQSMLQYILNVVEFGMDPQQAAEAASVNSYQLHSSFGPPLSKPGRIQLRRDVLPATRERLRALGYTIEQAELTSGPVTAIVVDQAHGTMTGAASDFGHDYGIAW
jgi:gamma-glutamyltranspeptidase/glutathione hydrolase